MSDSPQLRLEKKTSRFIELRHVPSVVVGTVNEDGLSWRRAWGLADPETMAPAGDDVLYRIASVTKVFTATAIVQLRDAGKLRLADPVTMHLEEFANVANPFGPIEEVNLRQLLTHTAGLPAEAPPRDPHEWSGAPMPATLAMLDQIRLVVPPYTYKYSNLGYALLGQVIERITGMPYERYLADGIFKPLGMRSTTLEPSELPKGPTVAQGYDARRFSDRLTRTVPIESGRVGAAGGLWSTLHDLGRWIAFQIGVAENDGTTVLERASLAEMQQCSHLHAADVWTEAQGLGWRATRRGETVLVGHPGGYFGFTAAVRFSPSERCGAIVLCNGRGDVDELALELARTQIEIEREARSVANLTAPTEARMSAAIPSRLLGAYSCEPLGGEIRVEWRHARLVVVDQRRSADGEIQETEIRLEGTDDPLVFTILDGDGIGEQALFLSGEDGEIELLRLGNIPYTRRYGAGAGVSTDQPGTGHKSTGGG